MSEDKKVGYMQPPVEGQFKKGKSGNPRGRPRKVAPIPLTNDRAIMQRIDAEVITVDGVMKSKRELELRILQAKALKGDLRAMQMLDRKRMALKLDQPAPRSGVLVVPQIPSAEEWAERAKRNQAKYREADYSATHEIEKDKAKT